MATSKLLLSHLRRCCSNSLSHAPLYHLFHTSLPRITQTQTPSHSPPSYFRSPLHFFHSRSVDRDYNNSEVDHDCNNFDDDSMPIHSEIIDLSERVIESSRCEESILPVRALISLLDAYHDFTGFPWWVIIASSTLTFRIAMLPVVILQLKKIQKIGELFPKLPPPFPPPLSGRSFIDQISHFRKERRALGCPSFLWFLASFSIQVPCFLLGVTSIRRMSLDCHPGFDCGGTLWFQNLTEFPHGVLGFIFPVLVAGLHYTNVQLSFRSSSLRKEDGLFGLFAKFYRLYLNVLTLPLLFIGFYIPQGSLVYWVTNSSFSVVQQLSLKHPAIRAKLGLPDKDISRAVAKSEEIDSPQKQREISAEILTPKELLALSVKLLSKGEKERAVPLLQLALGKDPDYIHALIVLGQTQLRIGLLVEAVECLQRAISKLFLAGHPTLSEDIDLLIVASQWAGVACIRLGKWAEGIVHLERIGNLKEPDEPNSKAHYFDGLVLLSSALSNVGRKAEAAKYLRLAAAYNSDYNELLEQLENGDDEFGSDLSNSRKQDY